MSELEEIKKWIEEEINCPITNNEWDETQYVNAGKILKYLTNLLQQSQPLQLSDNEYNYILSFLPIDDEKQKQPNCSSCMYYTESNCRKIDNCYGKSVLQKLAEIHKATSKEKNNE